MKFTVTIDITNLTSEQFSLLDKRMRIEYFNNLIKSSKKEDYILPKGWYVLYGFYKLSDVLSKTKKCTSFLSDSPAILITESVGRSWSNLDKYVIDEKDLI